MKTPTFKPEESAILRRALFFYYQSLAARTEQFQADLNAGRFTESTWVDRTRRESNEAGRLMSHPALNGK